MNEADFILLQDGIKDIGVNDEIFHRLKHLHIAQLGREMPDILADITRDERV